MLFPVYPEKLRKNALFKLKIRYWLLLLLAIGILMSFLGATHDLDTLLIAGVFAAAAGLMFFVTLNAKDTLVSAEIGEKGISLLDKRGNTIRSTEYRYVRCIEARQLQVTAITSENSKYNDFPGGGIDVKLIMVYFDGASCFEDLGLSRLNKKHDVYWCDKIFWHHNCIAFMYSDDAWKLLQTRLAAHSANNT